MKSKGHPRQSWLVQVNFKKKQLNRQDKVLKAQLIKKSLDKREGEEFEMAFIAYM